MPYNPKLNFMQLKTVAEFVYKFERNLLSFNYAKNNARRDTS